MRLENKNKSFMINGKMWIANFRKTHIVFLFCFLRFFFKWRKDGNERGKYTHTLFTHLSRKRKRFLIAFAISLCVNAHLIAFIFHFGHASIVALSFILHLYVLRAHTHFLWRTERIPTCGKSYETFLPCSSEERKRKWEKKINPRRREIDRNEVTPPTVWFDVILNEISCSFNRFVYIFFFFFCIV